MKVERKKFYSFEEGDVIVSKAFNLVAIRLATGQWATSEGDVFMNDRGVSEYLDSGTWFYMGNRIDVVTVISATVPAW